MENVYKILDIIRELKSNHIGCNYKICDVAENSTIDNHFDFSINNGFITPAKSTGKLSYRLVALPDNKIILKITKLY